ncbi:hypothetical protein ACV33L_31300, partial [Pseudomonas aeruginosa]
MSAPSARASCTVGSLGKPQRVRSTRVPLPRSSSSGTLVDLTRWGLPKEPTVQEALADGADIVTITVDKLPGGPPAELLLGNRELTGRTQTR